MFTNNTTLSALTAALSATIDEAKVFGQTLPANLPTDNDWTALPDSDKLPDDFVGGMSSEGVDTPEEFDADCGIVYGYLQDKLSAVNKAQEEAEEMERLDGVNTSWEQAHCEKELALLRGLLYDFFHEKLVSTLEWVEADAEEAADLCDLRGNSESFGELLDVSFCASYAKEYAIKHGVTSY